MSITIGFDSNRFKLKKLKLPTRYYHFNDGENYIKLLSIGEGIFPKDRIKTIIKLKESSTIITTESATKVYPSKKEYGINYINLELLNSNCEFINDELILYKNSKLIQLLRVKLCKDSTLFYTDILSRGRSFESFDFSSMVTRNSFYIDSELEYFENFDICGEWMKEYLKEEKSKKVFAKIYLKTENNQNFLEKLYKNSFDSFTYSKNKKLIVGVLSSENMGVLKEKVRKVWELYRETLGKSSFNLGKQ